MVLASALQGIRSDSAGTPFHEHASIEAEIKWVVHGTALTLLPLTVLYRGLLNKLAVSILRTSVLRALCSHLTRER